MRRIILVAIAVLLPLGLHAEEKKFTRYNNLVYLKDGKTEIKLDLAVPTKGDKPFALVVCIHGGSFIAGSKGSYSDYINMLAGEGYAAATIDYGLAPNYNIPQQIAHVKTSVRFLKAKAATYGIDPNRVAVLGSSAGGYHALMLGLSDDSVCKGEDPAYPEQSSRVQAVVNFFGPTDFDMYFERSEILEAEAKDMIDHLRKSGAKVPDGDPVTLVMQMMAGTTDQKSPLVKTLSVINHIDPKDPPVITFHGTKDNTVPVEQAKKLQKVLDERKARGHLELIKNVGHGLDGKSWERTYQMTLEFLKKNLAPVVEKKKGAA
ncbi:MAG: alpha/beta hydrolase [Planctomycetes bacterium]|nr:alpha/beta hydrolase [Planctomycetota bacterium]